MAEDVLFNSFGGKTTIECLGDRNRVLDRRRLTQSVVDDVPSDSLHTILALDTLVDQRGGGRGRRHAEGLGLPAEGGSADPHLRQRQGRAVGAGRYLCGNQLVRRVRLTILH